MHDDHTRWCASGARGWKKSPKPPLAIGVNDPLLVSRFSLSSANSTRPQSNVRRARASNRLKRLSRRLVIIFAPFCTISASSQGRSQLKIQRRAGGSSSLSHDLPKKPIVAIFALLLPACSMHGGISQRLRYTYRAREKWVSAIVRGLPPRN